MHLPVFGNLPLPHFAGTSRHAHSARKTPPPAYTPAELETMADAFLREANAKQATLETTWELPPEGLSREDHLFDQASLWAERQALENQLYQLEPSVPGLMERYAHVQAQAERVRDYPESCHGAWNNALAGVRQELDRLTVQLFSELCLQPESNEFDMPAVEQSDGSLNPDFLQPGNYQTDIDIPTPIPMDYVEARRFVKAVLENRENIPGTGTILEKLFAGMQKADRYYAPQLAYELLLAEAKDNALPRSIRVAIANATAMHIGDGRMIRESFEDFGGLDWKNNPVGAGVNYLKARSQIDHAQLLLEDLQDAPGLGRNVKTLQTAFADAGAFIDSLWHQLCLERMTGEDAEKLYESMHRLPGTPGVKGMLDDLQRLSSPFRIGGLE